MMHMKNLVQTAPIPGGEGWHTAVIEIDAASATTLLEGNTGNRRLAPGAMARYAAAMRKGDWKVSPEPLIFAPNGRLLNGQHRLRAVKATEIPQRFLCVFGVDESLFSVIDRGKPRSYSDALGLARYHAEASRLLAAIANSSSHNTTVTDSEVLRAAALIEESHGMLLAATSDRAAVFSTAPFRAAAALRITCGESPSFVTSLYRDLIKTNLSSLPPVAEPAMKAVKNGRWHSTGGAAIQTTNLVRAWDLYQEAGQNRSRLRDGDLNAGLAVIRKAYLSAAEDMERAMS